MMTRHNEEGFDPLADLFTEGSDNLATPHEFSADYRMRKAALLREYRESCKSEAQEPEVANAHGSVQADAEKHQKASRFSRRKVAAVALAAALAVVPTVGYAVVSNADFFANAFGTGARESVQKHDVDLSDEFHALTVTYPAREYVDVDVEEAERLLGDHLSTDSVEIMAGDHKITVLSVVRDGNAAVIHYTVSREGGVTALEWDELTNEDGHGAYFSDDYPVCYGFVPLNVLDEDGEFSNYLNGNVIVNEERTTPDSVDCYEYAASLYPLADDEAIELQITPSEGGTDILDRVTLPSTAPLPSSDFVSPDGDTATVSPISLQIGGEFGRGLGDDPYTNQIVIDFSNGTSYTVYDRPNNLDNTSYSLGRGGIEVNYDSVLVFNRLVNPESIERIVIDGVEFTHA